MATTADNNYDSRLSFFGEFADPQRESRFRMEHVETSRQLCIIIAAAVSIACVAFITNDSQASSHALMMQTARWIELVIAAACLAIAIRSRNWRVIYVTIYVLAIVVLITTIMIDSSRPTDYLLHLGPDLLILVGIYIILPSFRAQIFTASLFSAALLILNFSVKTPPQTFNLVMVLVSVLTANLIGFGVSIVYARSRRSLASQAESARLTRLELEDSQKKLRELQQLIPMCPSCNKIRDDEGFWHAVENYMSEHIGSQVSHGLCEACIRELYGDEYLR